MPAVTTEQVEARVIATLASHSVQLPQPQAVADLTKEGCRVSS